MNGLTPAPVGVEPRWHWVERRCQDLISAIERYSQSGHCIPPEWVRELADHTESLLKDNRKRLYMTGGLGKERE